MVAAVHAILRGFETVEAFQADTQALAHLPDEIGAGVVAGVIKGGGLSGGVVEVDVAVTDRRTELLVPVMGKTERGTPIGQSLELAVTLESGVTVEEAGVIAHPTDALAVDSQELQRIVLRHI